MTADEAWKNSRARLALEPKAANRVYFLEGFAAGQKAEREAILDIIQEVLDREGKKGFMDLMDIGSAIGARGER